MKLLSIAIFCLASIVACSPAKKTTVRPQRETELRSAINQRHYVFHARAANPVSGSVRQLSSEYDLRVTGDTLKVYLPYFGRAYSAPANLAGGGIELTSTDFAYEQSESKKGGWTIRLRPRDSKDVREFTLSISADGYGALQVNSVNRQPISFTGNVEPFSTSRKNSDR